MMGRGVGQAALIGLIPIMGCQVADRAPERTARKSGAAAAQVVAFRVPSESEITDPDILRSLRRGRALLRDTKDSLPAHVGNRLQCVSCHAMDGTQQRAIPLIGVYARFPQYRARSGKVDRLEDRVNDCFERSMNGRALDRASAEMRDLVTYMAFLSRGVPSGAQVDGQGVPLLEPVRGDTTRGARLFASTCSQCHGVDGGGTNAAPPLWGPESYNIGAGMARVRTAAAFIRSAMPLTQPGSLSPQQAFDLAEYVNTRPRPDFARKKLDWPRGDSPPDVAYPAAPAGRAKSP
jgi:thiosulfate dehydrogenase